MPLHKLTRQGERPFHKLTRTSERRTLVFILNTHLLRTIQERININDIRLDLRLEVLARRNAVVPPALRLHHEQVKQRHDGYIVDLRCVGREDRREVDGARSQYIDFNVAAVGVPAGKTAHQDLVRRFAPSRGLQEVSAVRVDYCFFDALVIGIKVVD